MTNYEENPKQICLSCKNKIVDFFIFKRRNEEARKIYRDSQYKSLILEVTGDPVILTENNPSNVCEDDDESLSDLLPENQLYFTFNDSTVASNEESQGIFDDESQDLEIPQLILIKAPLESPEEEIVEENSPLLPKRKLHPENWERTRRKIAKNMGKSYVTTSGKIVEAKRIKPDCGSKCRMQCNTRITDETRMKNFNEFYGLADIELQRKFILDHIQIFEPKKNTKDVSVRTRSIQRIFFLDGEKEGEMVQVCKKNFLNTLVISSQILDTIQFKASRFGSMVDLRGRYPRRKA